jgi:hypothetical protein
MIPTAAMNSGTASVDAIDPNATGYAVQKITRTKITQTWLASHTGPIERCACPRSAWPRAPALSSCHRPAPKSAPPRTA